MLFNSYTFIFFFIPLTLLLTALGRRYGGLKAANAILVTSSLVFYAFHDIRLLALIGGSIVGNYIITHFILAAQGRQRYLLTTLGIVLNLVVLGYFKYTNFFVENINALSGFDLTIAKIALPIGISFYTFQQVAYCADSYAGKIKDRDFLSYALFVSFFPQLIAGPIVHHSQVTQQYRSDRFARINLDDLMIGIAIFTVGLFSKKILADNFAIYATPYFALADARETISFLHAWQGALAYTFQIYFDFAGYSTMAIGLGRMFGVKLPVNFFSPYKSTSIIDFWRRWHITLSTFLRDYLYFPLGGNRKGPARRYVNLSITMLLGGLWHGASWNFVIWGGLHGLYLMINHAWRKYAARDGLGKTIAASPAFPYMAWGLTFFAVVCAWVGFRATTTFGNVSMLYAMGGMRGFDSFAADFAATDLKLWGLLAIGFVASLALPNMAQIFSNVRATYEEFEPAKAFGFLTVTYRPTLIWTIVIAILAGITVFYQSPTTEFLYWAF